MKKEKEKVNVKELQDEIEKHSINDQWAILKKIKARERDKARAKVNRLFERKSPKVEKNMSSMWKQKKK